MESYVVRIYRRRSGKNKQLVGIVETPRHGRPQAFDTFEGLWDILGGVGDPAPKESATVPAKGASAQQNQPPSKHSSRKSA
jgi:hypothetical protein